MLAELRSYRRMAMYVFLLLLLSILVFIFENYVEEVEVEGEAKFSMLPSWPSSKKQSSSGNYSTEVTSGSAILSDNCYLVEPITIIESCVKCTHFEKEALKAAYCAPSGYYDKVQCMKNGRITQRPCYNTEGKQASKLKEFSLLSMLSFMLSFVFVKYRRERVERRAYMKIQQDLAP